MPSIAISTNGNNGKVSDLEKKVENLNKLVEFYREENEKSEEEMTRGVANYYLKRLEAMEEKLAKLEGKELPPLEQKKRKGWTD